MTQLASFFASLAIRPDKGTEKGTERLLKRIKQALIGIVAIKTGQKFAGLIKDVSETADMYNKLAQTTGLASESIQQLEFAAQIGGANLDVLRTGLQRFARNATDARQGSESAQKQFSRLGVDPSKIETMEELLLQTADGLANLPEGFEKTGIAMQVFGRQGARLLPFFNQGREGINQLRQEFVDLGAQISTEEGAKFEQFNDDILRVNTAIRGLKNQAVIAILPVLQEMTVGFLDWIKANRLLLRQRLQEFFKGVGVVLKGLGVVMDIVVRGVGVLADVFGILEQIFIDLGLGAGTLTAILIVAAGKVLVAWFPVLLPFIAAAVVIAALILIGEDLLSWAKGGPSAFKDFFTAFKEFLGEKLVQIWDATIGKLIDLFAEFIEWAVGKFQEIADKAKEIAGQITQPFADAFDFVTNLGRRELTTNIAAQAPMLLQRARGLAAAAVSNTTSNETVNVENINVNNDSGDPRQNGVKAAEGLEQTLARRRRATAAAAGAGSTRVP